jgi:hypothetical protein
MSLFASEYKRTSWKRPHRRPRYTWDDNIKMYLRYITCESVNWSLLAQYRVQKQTFVNMAMNLRVPQKQEVSQLAEQPSTYQGRLCTIW